MIKKFLMTLALCFLALPAFAMLPYNSNGQITPPDSDTIYNYSLVASTAATVTWPTTASFANVTCPSAYYTSLRSGITVPAGTVTNGTGAALNSAQRAKGKSETAFYIISGTNQICSVEFWGN